MKLVSSRPLVEHDCPPVLVVGKALVVACPDVKILISDHILADFVLYAGLPILVAERADFDHVYVAFMILARFTWLAPAQHGTKETENQSDRAEPHPNVAKLILHLSSPFQVVPSQE